MAKKTKRQRQKLKQNEVKLSPSQQHQQAIVLIDNGHFSSGIVFLEKVFALDPENSEIKLQLLNAYDQLITINTESKELKKADLVLNKRLKLSKEQLNNWLVMDVFVQNERYADALTHYSEFHACTAKPNLKQKNILSKLIPYVFSRFDNLPKIFKVTDFYKESKLAYQLLQQAINGSLDDDQVKRIGILGSYKDLRLILKVFQCIKTNDDPQAYLLKVKEGSVFYDLANVLKAVTTKPHLAFDILRNVSKQGLLLFKNLKELNDKEYKLLLKLLAQEQSHPNPEHIFNILISYYEAFSTNGPNLLKGQLCHVEHGVKQYQKTVGKLTLLEKIKYNALWLDQSRDHSIDVYDVYEEFEELVRLYAKNKSQRTKAGIISLHLARFYAEDEEERISYYNDAVKYDPLNPTYYKLLLDEKIRTHGLSAAMTMKSLTTATELFPDNIKFQELLITNAFERGTYTKAIKLAQKLLMTNPVNKTARNILKKCSLSLSLQSAKKGMYNEIPARYQHISKYLSEQEQEIFKALFLVGNVLAHPLLSTLEKKDLELLNSSFGLLAFNIQGILLGYTLPCQISLVADLNSKLKDSLSTLRNFIDVLCYFTKETPKKGYGDLVPIINHALEMQNGDIDLLLELGFLLEDLGLKKILSGFAQYFDAQSAESQAAIIYFDCLKKRQAKHAMKAFSIIDKLDFAKKKLHKGHPLSIRIDKLIKKLMMTLPPQRGFMPPKLEEMLNFLEDAI
ncbi:MAG: Flp pilus assembly protein TadD [Francisellaceae bacterium]|jgi:Flp pilus assembly protein TadD